MKVGYINNLEETDVSKFNPLVHGVCVECSSKDAIPDISSPIPKCHKINKIIDEEEEEEEEEDYCYRDVLNPNFNSIFNKYVKGYGCVCDYYNGFVEVNVGGIGDKDGTNVNNSNGCIKIGKTFNNNNYHHQTHLAYYTLENSLLPKQIHEYKKLEQPFQSLFGKEQNMSSLLVEQPARDIVHEQDWLNRCIKPNPKQIIRRLNGGKWPVVHKRTFVNHYEKRANTFPISAQKLAIGRGFEAKHWYETTNMRYIHNAILGHPIVYGTHNAKNEKWRGKCTLNPLGSVHEKYFGLTMQYKPGSIVKLDTRGYENERYNVITIPPSYENEMMDPKSKVYLGILYNSYEVEN